MPLSHRYLFVGGLHRSGTSLVARTIASLPDVAAITDAPVPENEGVYLQGGIPHDALNGRPMHFGTDPEQHLTERHPLNRLETRIRMEADWAPWFGPGVWRVEKSPVNLTRMRLLQQLFPLSQFVVVLRHPQAVAGAVAKWVDMPFADRIDHWLDAHDSVAADLAHLHAVLVLRYEDLVARPEASRAMIAAFLDLPAAGRTEPLRDGNLDYRDVPGMTSAQVRRAGRWGYADRLSVEARRQPECRHPLTQVRRAVADAWL
ncbi:sulfotransferase [Roseobacter sp. HKCCA0434]|uniref:sulfotransferase family protein n=1 Tax=Roseobacter sp. HKCCA0434 TaxID=3079297 RepID=UPI0029058DA0|nr:sulfotransferase [Roseobacter sp. HKCCA0434]